MRKGLLVLLSLSVTGLIVALSCAADPGEDSPMVSIFDGQSLKGWHVSAKTGHSKTSNNTSGGKWSLENGAIIGTQDVPGNGGIIITDEQFGDFEVAVEMNNDFGPDSGLFLRSTEDGKAYQAMIDYHAKGNLMGVYGEGLGGKPSVRNFSFLDEVDEDRSGEGCSRALSGSARCLAPFLAPRAVERIAGANRRQSARDPNLDQRREDHGMDRD